MQDRSSKSWLRTEGAGELDRFKDQRPSLGLNTEGRQAYRVGVGGGFQELKSQRRKLFGSYPGDRKIEEARGDGGHLEPGKLELVLPCALF